MQLIPFSLWTPNPPPLPHKKQTIPQHCVNIFVNIYEFFKEPRLKNYVSSSHSGFAYEEYNTKSLKHWAF